IFCGLQVPVALPTERHRVAISCSPLDRTLYPQRSTVVDVSLQLRNHRGVRRVEIGGEVGVPVEQHHSPLGEGKAGQLGWGEHRVGVSRSGNSSLYDGRTPRVMGLEDGKLLVGGGRRAVGPSIIGDVRGKGGEVVGRVPYS